MSRRLSVLLVVLVGAVIVAGAISGYLREGFTGEGLVVGLMTMFDGSELGVIGEVLGGIALLGFVIPGLGVFVPLWFPTGRAPTPKWRWVGIVTVAGVVGIVGGWAILAFVERADTYNIDACTSIGSCSNIIGLILMLAGVIGAVISLVVRWIRSRGVERLQMKWLVLAFIVFLVGILAEFGGFQESIVANVLLPAGLFMIPVTIAIAVTRYRLYEIDRILSRTASYVMVIAVPGAVYFIGLAAMTSSISPDSPLAVAGSTLAVAALFNPVQRRVQGWVDRRFNRSRYDAQRVMDRIAGSLRDRVDSGKVVDGWASVVSETMQPVPAGVWVREAW
jgi:hypothetical protein